MEPAPLSDALARLGCPPEKCPGLAAQLDKRARQLAALQGGSYEQALAHLLSLMAQGMSGQISPSPAAPPDATDSK